MIVWGQGVLQSIPKYGAKMERTLDTALNPICPIRSSLKAMKTNHFYFEGTAGCFF